MFFNFVYYLSVLGEITVSSPTPPLPPPHHLYGPIEF